MNSSLDPNIDKSIAYRSWADHKIDQPPEWSVVIPAYNESERVVPTVGAIAAHLCRSGTPWELIVADDGSTDDTVEVLNGLGLANMRVLVAEQNRGKGSAVRRGMQAASGNIVLFADADQSTPIEQFETLLKALDNGADVAIGSRSMEGAQVANKSATRKLFSHGLNILVRFGFGIPYQDTQCGFKMFTAPAARALFAHQLIDQFSFDLEILYLARKANMTVAEIPVEWIDAPGSTVDPAKVAVEFLKDMAVIRWNDIRGRYRGLTHDLSA